MNQELKLKFPVWTSDFSQGKFVTCMTDDLDSLLGCAIENYVKGNPINYFYNFKKLYVVDKLDTRKAIGIDMAIVDGRCWDNHVVRIKADDKVNPLSANLNAINHIYRDNYGKKYAMSTSLLMWAYYGLELPKTDEGKAMLLAIDSGYLGHYNDYFRSTHNQYLELLGLSELIDLLNKYTKTDFDQLQRIYNLKAKIHIIDGFLHTTLPLAKLQGFFNFPIELPKEQFTLRNRFNDHKANVTDIKNKDSIDRLFSFALTRKKEVKYSTII